MPSSTLYAASGIIYAKATPANLAVAISASGGTDEEITDRINPPTLETGKITASVSSPTVTGVDVNFERDCKAGEYIFAYGAGAVPVLVGRIQSIDGEQQLTLTEDASSDADETPYGLMKILLSTNENILIRVPRIPLNEKQSYIPDWSAMRVRPYDANQFNDQTTFTSLSQYSETGIPVVIDGSPTNIPFLIRPSNRFTVYTSGSYRFCWREQRELPNYIFAVYNPFGENSQQNLSGGTMYKLFTTELIPGILVQTNFSASVLEVAGYSVASDATQPPPPTE